MLSEIDVKNLEDLCRENRKNILKMVYNAQSGHIGGASLANVSKPRFFAKKPQKPQK